MYQQKLPPFLSGFTAIEKEITMRGFLYVTTFATLCVLGTATPTGELRSPLLDEPYLRDMPAPPSPLSPDTMTVPLSLYLRLPAQLQLVNLYISPNKLSQRKTRPNG